jgi:hypothetical protein
MKPKVKTWLRNIENGNIRNNTEKILSYVKANTPEKGATYPEGFELKGIDTYVLRQVTGISHQSLTAILSVLNDEGLVRPIGETEIHSSHYSIWAFVYDLEYRKRVQHQRMQDRYIKWLKKADEFMDLMGHSTVKMICYEQQQYNVFD